jgi:hypothetical protein
VKNRPFGDAVILIVFLIMVECPIGDIFGAVGAVFKVGVERKALCCASTNRKFWDTICHLDNKRNL